MKGHSDKVARSASEASIFARVSKIVIGSKLGRSEIKLETKSLLDKMSKGRFFPAGHLHVAWMNERAIGFILKLCGISVLAIEVTKCT